MLDLVLHLYEEAAGLFPDCMAGTFPPGIRKTRFVCPYQPPLTVSADSRSSNRFAESIFIWEQHPEVNKDDYDDDLTEALPEVPRESLYDLRHRAAVLWRERYEALMQADQLVSLCIACCWS